MINDYEILFKDSAEVFTIVNSRMIQIGNLIVFRQFDEMKCIAEYSYPVNNIYRIKRTM